MGHVSDSIELLTGIDWSVDDEQRHGSNLRLVRESAVRFAHWIPHVEPTDCDRLAPFFDIAACFDKSLAAPDFTVPTIPNHFCHYLVSNVLPWFLKWQTLADKQPLPANELDPFEPLVLCFVRGGRPYNYKGFMHVEHCASFAFGYGQWPAKFCAESSTAISDIDLDEFDRKFNARLGG